MKRKQYQMFIKFRKLHFMKTKLSILILLFIFLNIQLTIQAQQVASLSEVATISENGFEGFGKNIVIEDY